MIPCRLLNNLLLIALTGVLLVFSRSGLAASSLVPESGAIDAVIQSPITANDLKPLECAGIDLQNTVIGSGTFTGTVANDLILGSTGEEDIDSLAGDDCILGGSGNDRLFGGTNLSSQSVLDQFNAVSYTNNDGSQSWSVDWQEIGENDGPVDGDVNVELPQSLGVITLYADQDTYIEENHPDSNFGTTLVGKVKGRSSDNKRSLYHFDLSAIPGDSTVTSAFVYFYNVKSDNAPVSIHRITGDWTEDGATWNNITRSYDPNPAGSVTPLTSNQYYSADITPLFQQWVSGTFPNQGVMLIASPEASETRYSSREEVGTAQDPYLTYTLAPSGQAQSLRIQNSIRGAWRQVDLGSSQFAQLQFDSLRLGLDDASDYVKIEISGNGGSSWSELARFSGPASDNQFLPSSYDITNFRAGNTQIRFLSSAALGVDDKVYFDNIRISYSVGSLTGTGDILVGGEGDDALDGGDGQDACFGGEGSDVFINCETIFDP